MDRTKSGNIRRLNMVTLLYIIWIYFLQWNRWIIFQGKQVVRPLTSLISRNILQTNNSQNCLNHPRVQKFKFCRREQTFCSCISSFDFQASSLSSSSLFLIKLSAPFVWEWSVSVFRSLPTPNVKSSPNSKSDI